jgi:hypothetical protein
MAPPVLMRPILSPLPCSVNQRAPSGPAAMPSGPLFAVEMGYSLMAPPVVMRPILLPKYSVNQRAPSGPAAMPWGPLLAVGVVYSVIVGPAAAAVGPRSPVDQSDG